MTINTIAFFGVTKQDSYNRAKKYLMKLTYGDVRYVRDQPRINTLYADLTDGTRIMNLSSDISSLGHRYTDLVIQKGIDQDIVNTIIRPMLIDHENGDPYTIEWYD